MAASIIESLGYGIVPREGLEYIAVGREEEKKAFLNDIATMEDGGTAIRFIVGDYGSGKSFMLQMIRNEAMNRGFVVVNTDLSPEKRLHGTQKQGLATYKELIASMSTKTKPNGGALTQIIEKWISLIQSEVISEQGIEPGTVEFDKEVKKKVYSVSCEIEFLVNGFDFAKAIVAYYEAFISDDNEKKSQVIRWFRGEYSTKSEAKKDLGINMIVDDHTWFNFIKIFSSFVTQIGYKGIAVFMDELVNLYKIPTKIARDYNYEKLLMIYNEILQGDASHLGIFFGATPECIEDTRTGLFSYGALKSRLENGKYSQMIEKNYLSPIIRLDPLEQNQVLELLMKLSKIHAVKNGYEPNVSSQEVELFIKNEYSRIGARERLTPRDIIRSFIDILNVLCQSPGKKMQDIIGQRENENSESDNDEFAFFEV